MGGVVVIYHTDGKIQRAPSRPSEGNIVKYPTSVIYVEFKEDRTVHHSGLQNFFFAPDEIEEIIDNINRIEGKNIIFKPGFEELDDYTQG